MECRNCRFLSNQPISLQMFTDASNHGWRASLNGQRLWNRETANQSINYCQLLAVLLALHSFCSLLQSSGHVVQVMTDNNATAANINHWGGPNPGLTDLTWSLWDYAHNLNVTLTVWHLPCVENRKDNLLCHMSHLGWCLNSSTF